jgi:hypothetical protein
MKKDPMTEPGVNLFILNWRGCNLNATAPPKLNSL